LPAGRQVHNEYPINKLMRTDPGLTKKLVVKY
jgi:hypothetical protein